MQTHQLPRDHQFSPTRKTEWGWACLLGRLGLNAHLVDAVSAARHFASFHQSFFLPSLPLWMKKIYYYSSSCGKKINQSFESQIKVSSEWMMSVTLFWILSKIIVSLLKLISLLLRIEVPLNYDLFRTKIEATFEGNNFLFKVDETFQDFNNTIRVENSYRS